MVSNGEGTGCTGCSMVQTPVGECTTRRKITTVALNTVNHYMHVVPEDLPMIESLVFLFISCPLRHHVSSTYNKMHSTARHALSGTASTGC
ncbi:hypothetical protein PAXRUDRAFT_508511 [Paxillus rubicundulus Ve08.2h10]|uniref:Uncharacterized protein n=1 Tax=Paxillus rubicundulus Ve08.2h10 TaxID=930991 RepID=A0A0D0DMY9_9AGAM|nr:hypothetical protein PAXRUDRAFT_533843 [Paxillus rubicundulus Ve08.2h10]KIK93535.1 hypothetical protein PAXRUDRAFT_508511 [Paxillus rubicundulus Ve08.2h10]